jgi:two-component system alkaline phosphatase synthesis response regulator PhoP
MSRVLVAEDEAALAFGLKLDLEAEGYRVETAGDGETALQRASTGDFDLILLDLMLPKKDGLEVLRSLRRAGVRTQVIILTARAQEAEKILGLETGADDYITKPFSPRELRARVRAALRRITPTSASEPEMYAFADVEVDFTRHEVRRAGTPIDLTPIEFNLLATFCRNRGRALTREQLLDLAWGRGIAVTERVVDSHVVRVRKAIEPDPSNPRFIVSVRSVGYRFEG